MAQTRDVKEPLYIENTCLKAEPLSCLTGEEDRFNAESIVRIMSALDRNDCRMEIADDWGIQVSKETKSYKIWCRLKNGTRIESYHMQNIETCCRSRIWSVWVEIETRTTALLLCVEVMNWQSPNVVYSKVRSKRPAASLDVNVPLQPNKKSHKGTS